MNWNQHELEQHGRPSWPKTGPPAKLPGHRTAQKNAASITEAAFLLFVTS
jgi:hypothetical protein